MLRAADRARARG
jgi:hypothetical protein